VVDEEQKQTQFTRRHFMAGVLGAGAAIIAAGGDVVLSGCTPSKEEQFEELVSRGVEDEKIQALNVDPERLIEAIDFEEVPMEDYLELQATHELPFGSLVHQMGPSRVLVLLPGEEGEGFRKIGTLDLGSGTLTTVIDTPVSTGRNALIYDARASDGALIWVEVDVGEQDWHVYAATLEGTVVRNTQLVEEGDADYEPSMLAVAGRKVYWTVMPMAAGPANQEDSFFRALDFAQGDETGQRVPYTVLTSHGRMITNPLVTDGIVTFVPRVDTQNVYYQLTALNCSDDRPVDFIVLPQSLRVTEAIYMNGSFTFSIESNYDYAGGLKNFGTYRDMGDGAYLHVGRPPVCPAVSFGKFLIIKTPASVLGIDPVEQKLFIVKPPTYSTDYGEALVGWGVQDRIVTSSLRLSEDTSSIEATLVRVFGPTT
jgi:hypothetical protein